MTKGYLMSYNIDMTDKVIEPSRLRAKQTMLKRHGKDVYKKNALKGAEVRWAKHKKDIDKLDKKEKK